MEAQHPVCVLLGERKVDRRAQVAFFPVKYVVDQLHVGREQRLVLRVRVVMVLAGVVVPLVFAVFLVPFVGQERHTRQDAHAEPREKLVFHPRTHRPVGVAEPRIFAHRPDRPLAVEAQRTVIVQVHSRTPRLVVERPERPAADSDLIPHMTVAVVVVPVMVVVLREKRHGTERKQEREKSLFHHRARIHIEGVAARSKKAGDTLIYIGRGKDMISAEYTGRATPQNKSPDREWQHKERK